MTYSTHDVSVPGGRLRVGSWRSPGELQRVVLAVHGITATHRTWQVVADQLPPGTLLLAPDLRGRGRSGSLPGPSGLTVHAVDCALVLDELAGGRCDVVVGHSMGGFVAVLLAAAAPVGRVVLVDGGIPLSLPPGVDVAEAMAAGLGPAVARLSMTFPTRDAYQDFWRAHPAFAGRWSDAVADYADYDLDPSGPPFVSSCAAGLIAHDYPQMFAGGPVEAAWAALAAPVTFLRAPRGLMDEPGGFYPVPVIRRWVADHPNVTWQEVPEVNHYTIVLGTGAATVVAALSS